ncbi:MAG: FAD-dependent oxidoreductase, partial [Planctomycetes bacterium]|nr:FAD-dependent oxidoreductase [Planctomycetota bacterium]
VVGLDTSHREIILAAGERVRYDRLLLAMGCRPAVLPIPGAEAEGVFGLRTLADAEAIRQWMAGRRRAVVLGESMVSLHLAEGLTRLGVEVDHLLMGEHFWPEVLNPAASSLVAQVMQQEDVRLRRRVTVEEILARNGRVCGVHLATGERIECDMVGHGCSFRPNTDFLRDTPVKCDGGVLVNDQLETSVPGVFAAGDCVSFGRNGPQAQSQFYSRWQDSFVQGETAAANILGRKEHLASLGRAVKSDIFGLALAALGRSNVPDEDPAVQTVCALRGTTYRRLIFKDDILVGAILMGDVEHAEILGRHIRRGASRSQLEASLIPALMRDQLRLDEALSARCPICTDHLLVPSGALVGSRFTCNSCGTALRLIFSDGRPTVAPEEDV